MSALQQAAEFSSVFDWQPARSRRRVLTSCVVASALLHGICFYLFQIIYPPTVALLPPPARVNIITPDSEDGRVLLRWIEAEDPALSSTTQRPPDLTEQTLPSPAYIPSFAGHRPTLRELPPDPPDLRVPSARPPAPVPRPRATAPAPLAVRVPTTISFGENLTVRSAPKLEFQPARSEPPQAAQFRLAVDESGTVRHLLLDASSGDSALDEQARAVLLLFRFAGVEAAPLTWTTTTIAWGNDLAPASTAKAPRP